MTMVSIPAAIPLATGRSSPSLGSKQRQSHRRPVMGSATPPPAVGATPTVDPVPPTLDCALLAAPPGAANVLRSARLSLLHSLPSVGIAWSLWCGHCGSLREGFGGAETPRGCKRDSDGEVKRDDVEDVADELERELEKTLAAMAEAKDGNVAPSPGPQPLSAPARKPQRRRKSPRCTTCGAKFRRPTPAPPPYPPARAAARTRRQSALAQMVKPDDEKVDADTDVESTERALSPAGTVDASQLFGSSGASIPTSGATTPTATLTRSPSLAHIPKSDANPPTYPMPLAAPAPKPHGATPTTTLPTSPPPAKKRKTKKSGLAKLLAHNAAREAEKAGSGNWGLG